MENQMDVRIRQWFASDARAKKLPFFLTFSAATFVPWGLIGQSVRPWSSLTANMDTLRRYNLGFVSNALQTDVPTFHVSPNPMGAFLHLRTENQMIGRLTVSMIDANLWKCCGKCILVFQIPRSRVSSSMCSIFLLVCMHFAYRARGIPP